MSKERRKGNHPTPNNLSLYTLRLPPSNHPPCSDVSSKYSTMILHTISTTLINTTTTHHPTSQHLRPLPYHNKLYSHLSATPSHYSRVSQCLHLSVTLIRPTSLILFLYTPQPVTCNPNCNSGNLSGYIYCLLSFVQMYIHSCTSYSSRSILWYVYMCPLVRLF